MWMSKIKPVGLLMLCLVCNVQAACDGSNPCYDPCKRDAECWQWNCHDCKYVCVDVIPPNIDLPDLIKVDECESDVPPAPPLDEVTVTDNCAVKDVTFLEDVLYDDERCEKTIVRIWTAVDECGNTATRSQVYVITQPVGGDSLPENVDTEVNCASQVETPDIIPFVENCAGEQFNVSYEERREKCPPKIVRQWKVEADSCGNPFTITQIYRIRNPIYFNMIPEPRTIECPSHLPEPLEITATQCGEPVEVTLEQTSNNKCPQVITRKWTAVGVCGLVKRSISQRFTIANGMIIENAPAAYDLTFDCIKDVDQALLETPSMPVLKDCLGREIEGGITYDSSDDTGAHCERTITRTWVYEDLCENQVTTAQRIYIKPDEEPPVLSLPDDKSICVDYDPDTGMYKVPDLRDHIGIYENCCHEINTLQSLSPGDEIDEPRTLKFWAYDCCGNQTNASIEIKHHCECLPEKSTPGAMSADASSVFASFALGKNLKGGSAGQLFIHCDIPHPALATPRFLKFASNAWLNVDVVYDEKRTLNQVKAPQVLADIQVIDEFAYEILFYLSSQVGAKNSEGIYQLTGQPYVRYTIANPERDPWFCGKLTITEQRDQQEKIVKFSYDKNENAWSLNKGEGLSVKTVTRAWDEITQTRTETVVISNATTGVAYKERAVYKKFADDLTRKITQIVDPEQAALTNTWTYYTDPEEPHRYGKIKSEKHPDGSWQRYDYNTEGRQSKTVSPWLNASIGDDESLCRVKTYDYTPVDPLDAGDSTDSTWKDGKPRTIVETIRGIEASRTYNAYYVDAASGGRVHIAKRCATQGAAYDDASNMTTVTRRYPVEHPAARGPIKSIVRTGGLMTGYVYEFGTYTPNGQQPGVFTPGPGQDFRVITTQGLENQPDGVANKTTRTIEVMQLGQAVLKEQQVYNGADYETIDWTVTIYDELGRPGDVYRNNGSQKTMLWDDCCGMIAEINEQGNSSDFLRDDLGRVKHRIDRGVHDIVTDFRYDAAGHTLAMVRRADDLRLTTSNTFDTAGRQVQSVNQADLITASVYEQGGRKTSVILPGGATQSSERYLDGQTMCKTGTAVVSATYVYRINDDGTLCTEVYAGPLGTNSPRWQRTTTDMLGRTIMTESSGFGGTIETNVFLYQLHKLVRTQKTGMPDTLYLYNLLGDQYRSGLDIDGNGQLDLVSMDQISESETCYVYENNAWWHVSKSISYPFDDNAAAVTNHVHKKRLTGFTGNITEETISIDIHGNATVSRTEIDRAKQEMRSIVDYPDSDIDAVTLTRTGLVVSATTRTGVEYTYDYDALRRRIATIDPRIGPSVTHFNDKGQVDWIQNPASNRTQFVYDAQTGRRWRTIDPSNQTVDVYYDLRGQVTNKTGTATYPIAYVFDEYGQMVEMRTQRNNAWDNTYWQYDLATGLLTNKLDDELKGVSYTYKAGRLTSRTWARGESTFYYHNPAGVLTNIDYSAANTPDITYVVNRQGKPVSITDGFSARTFGYDDTLLLTNEVLDGLYAKTITHHHDQFGRNTGFSVGNAYNIHYAYTDQGRFNNVTWSSAHQGSLTFAYSYVPDSDLVQTMNNNQGLTWTFKYEADRNNKTNVINTFNATVISRYDYCYDARNHRSVAQNRGLAFVQEAYNRYTYNPHSEISSDRRYLGADIHNTENPVQNEFYEYIYDNTGNRVTFIEALHKETRYGVNNLNQYTAITNDSGILNFQFDADGNMTNDGVRAYTWNGENRLIEIAPLNETNGAVKLTFGYDYMGRRIWKQALAHNGSYFATNYVSTFLYDGWNMVAEYRDNESGEDQTFSYIHGLDLSQSLQGAGGIGGILATVHEQDSDTNMYYFAYDANGNVGQLIDESGVIAAHYEYSPFGKTVAKSGAVADANPFRFSSKYKDESGLAYYGFRYYSAEWGRWINRDPIEENGGIHLYAFVMNQPIMEIDYNGHVACSHRGGCHPSGDPPLASQDYDAPHIDYPRRIPPDIDPNDVIPRGVSKCVLTGFLDNCKEPIKITINNGTCTKPCSLLHELTHYSDYYNCWASAKKYYCRLKNWDVNGIYATRYMIIRDEFYDWYVDTLKWAECRGWTASLLCARAMQSFASQPRFDEECCRELDNYIDLAEKQVAEFCPGQYRACPDFSTM